MDDTLLGRDTFVECRDNVFTTLTCFEDLGFYIHPQKSIVITTQDTIFLGYLINPLRMTITSEKKQKIKRKIEELLIKSSTIREASSLLGSIVASFEAVLNGRLHYRHTEFNKISAFYKIKGISKPNVTFLPLPLQN